MDARPHGPRSSEAELGRLRDDVITSFDASTARLAELNNLLAGPKPTPRPSLRVIAGGRE